MIQYYRQPTSFNVQRHSEEINIRRQYDERTRDRRLIVTDRDEVKPSFMRSEEHLIETSRVFRDVTSVLNTRRTYH